MTWSRWVLGGSLGAALGCGPIVDLEDDSGADGSAGDSATSTAGGDGASSADGGNRETVGATRGDAADDSAGDVPVVEPVAFFTRTDRLELTISTYLGAACPDPTPAFECQPFVQWAVTFELRPTLQPGEYRIGELMGFVSETAAGTGGDCAGGAGSLVGEGSLVIETVGPVIEGAIVGGDFVFTLDAPIDLKFAAPECAP